MRSANFLMTDSEFPVGGERNRFSRNHSMVGKDVEISYECVGALRPHSGKKAEVVGVYERFGRPVALMVVVEGTRKRTAVSLRDVYLDRKLVRDFSPPNQTSETLKSGLKSWTSQREYWLSSNAGLESMCFDLACVSDSLGFRCLKGGEESRGEGITAFEFVLQSGHAGEYSSAVFPFLVSGESWYTSAMVSNGLVGPKTVRILQVEDHWQRVFTMGEKLSPRESWRRNFVSRRKATETVLVPMAKSFMGQIVPAYESIVGRKVEEPRYSLGFSRIRVPPNSIGLNDPPTDTRPYHVVSISPEAARNPKYLSQVVLHECIHVVVGKIGGDPHNGVFDQVAAMVGLEPKHRD